MFTLISENTALTILRTKMFSGYLRLPRAHKLIIEMAKEKADASKENIVHPKIKPSPKLKRSKMLLTVSPIIKFSFSIVVL